MGFDYVQHSKTEKNGTRKREIQTTVLHRNNDKNMNTKIKAVVKGVLIVGVAASFAAVTYFASFAIAFSVYSLIACYFMLNK